MQAMTRVFRGWLGLAVLAALCLGGATAAAQTQSLPRRNPGVPQSPGQTPNAADENEPDAIAHRALEAQSSKRNSLRQQQIVTDTDKLLQLALELKAEVDKNDNNTLSLSVLNKAEEIEKLARGVKDKMKAQ
jgi:hypothetical protein